MNTDTQAREASFLQHSCRPPKCTPIVSRSWLRRWYHETDASVEYRWGHLWYFTVPQNYWQTSDSSVDGWIIIRGYKSFRVLNLSLDLYWKSLLRHFPHPFDLRWCRIKKLLQYWFCISRGTAAAAVILLDSLRQRALNAKKTINRSMSFNWRWNNSITLLAMKLSAAAPLCAYLMHNQLTNLLRL